MYSPSTNGEFFPVEVISYVSLVGESEDGVILDADSTAGVMKCRNVTSSTISNMTLTGGSASWSGGGIYCNNNSSPSLTNVTISGNSAYWSGGGIFCENSSPSLTNVTISGNSASSSGGGIYCYYSSPSLENVTISENTASEIGGGIYCSSNSSLSLTNVTISDNSADDGGGIYCIDNSNPSLVNCILWNDSPQEVYFYDEEETNSITITYSDMHGGEESIVTNNNGTVYWEEGNIDANPLFCEPDSSDYTLAENSPCVGTGQDGANMGAYGVGCEAIDLEPVIEDIANTTINEDEELSITLSAESPHGYTLTFSTYSDTADVFTSVLVDTLTLSTTENWNGFSQVTVIVTDEVGLSDTTSFELIVNPVNDSPGDFLLLSPANNSEIIITADNLDEIIQFSWEESIDVDGDELTYSFDGIEFFTFEPVQENQLSMTYAEMAELMNEQELDYISGEWTVIAVDGEYSVPASNGHFTLTIDATALSIDELNIPEEFALHNNYPNPFNPVTTIRYDIPEQADVEITIHNLLGQMVKTLVNETMNPGKYSVIWDGTNNAGMPLSSGVYIYRLVTQEFSQSKKLILLK